MPDKLKLLFFGPVTTVTQCELLVTKLHSLQNSKAGPFDAAFVVGATAAVELITVIQTTSLPSLPVYLHDTMMMRTTTGDQYNNNDSKYVQMLAPNLYLLQTKTGNGVVHNLAIAEKKPPLVMVTCPSRYRGSPSLNDQLQHVSYTGADILLTSEWPQGIETIMPGPADNVVAPPPPPPVSYDVAHVALLARARYHIVPSPDIFGQSPPFAHVAATTNTVPCQHVGRVVALVAMNSNANDKAHKCVHALGVAPLHSLSMTELAQQRPDKVWPCPYLAEASSSSAVGLSEASARRILAEDRAAAAAARGTSVRFAPNKKKRQRDDNDNGGAVPVDLTNKTLFVHGLHQDVTGLLQSQAGDVLLLQAFTAFGATLIRKPPHASTSSFCFVEFTSHDAAQSCLQQTGGIMAVNGVDLTIKWGKSSSHHVDQHDAKKIKRLTEAEARDSARLYYKLPKDDNDDENVDEAHRLEQHQKMAELLRVAVETTLEDALNDDGGGADGGDDNGNRNRITAANEPALRVQLDAHARYGFLNFASHAAASMVLATLTGSTNGGRIHDEHAAAAAAATAAQHSAAAVVPVPGIHLNWASPVADTAIIRDDESGFTFTRRHFPPDARQDCWFCLASEACEKHLIVAVYDNFYAAMPKGPIHPAHVLLIPVQHSSQGVLHDDELAHEMETVKATLRQHAATVHDCVLFCFERAMQTKHGYHTHLQCIPVEKAKAARLQVTLLAQAQHNGMKLRELQTADLNWRAVLGDPDDDGGYFYAEIGNAQHVQRFLHRESPATPGSNPNKSCPLQFGREVVATVEERPDYAHWKSCVLDTAQEAQLAQELRASLEKVTLAAPGSSD